MIREFQMDDINKVADIWLDTNIKAHNFIPAEYWKSNFKSVKEALLLAEVYVYEYDTEIQGFIGLNDEYVEGIFVSGEMQSQGLGKILLNYAKDKRNKLYLNVYQKNARAISFYKREEGYETLLETMTEIENRYNEEKGLVRAEQSTSNDAFPEPENAGYSLGSECYYMKAYDSMAKIEKLLHGENEKSKKWSKISEQLCEKIREEYWNDEAGYFTSGPKGSEAYENQIWETSGEEAALWDKFHIATPEQKREILNSGIHTAMTPYGIRLFPHRKEHNHFVGPVWPVWESGFASAAAESQNKELLLTMIAQQMRTAVLHKNFHEVLEADTGKSWRWPGQLWHACGFAAQILYGVFGISYDEQGMRFNPCVPEIFKEIEIQNLNYQSAKLTVKISGTGTVECVILDDEKVDFIPYSLTGNHIVHIKLTETESECI